MWLVLGIGLFRNRPIEEVVDSLDIALPGRGAVAKSAVPSARKRLGDAPVQWLFEHCADHWTKDVARQHDWRGLSLFGIDGTSFRTPESESNRAEFGGWVAGSGDSATPLVRVVALMALRSHLLVRARLGPYSASSELAYARELVDAIPAHSLTILDALYMSAGVLHAVESGIERHWMTIAKRNTKMRVIEQYDEWDALVEMDVSAEARAQDASLPKQWRARAVTYRRPGFEPRTIMTSLRDPTLYPADEVRDLYHERWEIELGYDELKTELMDSEPTLRSRTPVGVRQEIWGTLLAYNLVRLEMNRIANKIAVVPTRISFAVSLALIRSEFEWSAITRSPGAIPKHLKRLEEGIKRFLLPERRSKRSYPRVALDFRRYPRKKREPAK